MSAMANFVSSIESEISAAVSSGIFSKEDFRQSSFRQSTVVLSFSLSPSFPPLMASLIRFQPITGAHDEEPYCYVLYIDQVAILLDCGWSDFFDVSRLEGLKRIAKHVDLILLSHGDLEHVGALPYLVSKLQVTCPIYATLAVVNTGRLTLQDAWKSKRMWSDFDLFSMDDINDAFDRVITLKYSENIALAGKCVGISCVPLAAGHTVGGTVWRLKKDTDEIVYAVSYNHKKERHLNGTVLTAFSRPSLLISDAYNASNVQPTRKQRDAELMGASDDP